MFSLFSCLLGNGYGYMSIHYFSQEKDPNGEVIFLRLL